MEPAVMSETFLLSHLSLSGKVYTLGCVLKEVKNVCTSDSAGVMSLILVKSLSPGLVQHFSKL